MDTILSQETLKKFGKDFLAFYRITDGRYEDLDFDVRQAVVRGVVERDLAQATGVQNVTQAIIHRLKTRSGELARLGHPDYGSRHHELIGEPNTEHNRRLIKLYILQALDREPRIEKILRADIRYDRRLNPDRVDIILDLKLGFVNETINLVIPFMF